MTPGKRYGSARLIVLFSVLMTLVTGNISFATRIAAAAPSDDFVYMSIGQYANLPLAGAGYTVTYTDAGGVEQTIPGAYGTTIYFGGGASDLHEIRVSGNFESIRNTTGFCSMADIKQWGTTAWTSLEHAFEGCSFVNYSATDTPNLSLNPNLKYMFARSNFNGDISNWDTSKVTNMQEMFYQARNFNQPLNNWDVSNVTNMKEMFGWAGAFNQPLDKWDTSKVTDMSNMFYLASTFNQPLNDWNTSNVTSTEAMFDNAYAFNQPLDKWDTSNVTTMRAMFSYAQAFDQSLAAWDISKVTNMDEMLNVAGLSMTNYDATLIAWSGKNVQQHVSLGAVGLGYFTSSDARQSLINNNGWTITGDFLAAGIIKVVAFDSSSLTLLAGAEYDIIDNADGVAAHIVAGADGVATTLNLPLGDYRVVGTSAPNGYILDTTPVPVSLAAHGQVAQVTVTATLATARIQVVKADQATGAKLAGAEYDIIDNAGGVAAHIMTDADGVATTLNLPLGDYRIVETKAPNGYILDATPIPVSLAAHNQMVQVTVTATLATARIQVVKADPVTGAKLTGAEYDILSTVKRGVVAHIVTGADGVATSGALPLGNYVVVETKPPAGYLAESIPVPVTLTTHDQIFQVILDGTAVSGRIEVTKTDPSTGAKLAGAEYDIIDSVGGVVAHIVTGADGVATTLNLPLGDYRIVETKAPNGYILDATPVPVSITAHGQVVQKTVNGTQLTVTVIPVPPTDQVSSSQGSTEADASSDLIRGVSTLRALPSTGGSATNSGGLALLILGSIIAMTLGLRRKTRNN